MEKWKQLRGKTPVKVIAFLLALVLAVAVCAGAGGALYLFARYGSQSSNTDSSRNWDLMMNYQSSVRDYLFFTRYRNSLTAEGQERYQALQEQLASSATNLRFRALTESGRTVCGNGSAAFWESNEDIWTESVSAYDLSYDRHLSYYLDFSKISDWSMVYGTAEDWAETDMTSAYYYSSDGEESDWYDSSMDAVAADVADEDTGTGMTSSESAATESPSSGPFYYYVYQGSNPEYTIELLVDTDFPARDDFSIANDEYQQGRAIYNRWFVPLLAVGGGCLLGFCLLLAWLTWSWGWDKTGTLALRGLNRLPVEAVLAGLACMAGLLLLTGATSPSDSFGSCLMTFGLAGLIGAPAALAAWLIVAAQIKTRTFLERSLCCRLVRWGWSRWRSLCQWGKNLAKQWPLYWKVAVFFGLYSILYLLWMGCVAVDAVYSWYWWPASVLALLLPILPLAVIACKWAVDWWKLRQSVKRMVKGELSCTIDSTYMLPDLKEHARDLGNLSVGLSKAVEEQVKSQRFKTELITNVSHDLKTPLTSIINYVDLLKKTDIQDETVRGYIDVLDRKSQRLKTLTEDLVEASKAASGTIAVNLERLDLAQLVNQAVAEYDERLEHAALTPVVSIPKEPCMVLADGRHLWRVLDNLLGNCTKYAMPGTRVYLDVTASGKQCTVTVKNISADPLNVPAEELMKRFVRGDSARSTEGSGLGLSIARNLTATQKGSFDLVVDGDLFKAIVTLPQAETPAGLVRSADHEKPMDSALNGSTQAAPKPEGKAAEEKPEIPPSGGHGTKESGLLLDLLEAID